MNRNWKHYVLVVLSAGLLSLFGALIYADQLPDVQDRYALNLTIGSSPLPSESSTHDVLRAAEHFSDMILGWTVEPGFSLSSEASFNGRRQEKQNLMFFIETDDREDALELMSKIEWRIEAYNNQSNSSFNISLSSITEVDSETNKLRILLGAILLGLLVGTVMIFVYDTIITYRR